MILFRKVEVLLLFFFHHWKNLGSFSLNQGSNQAPSSEPRKWASSTQWFRLGCDHFVDFFWRSKKYGINRTTYLLGIKRYFTLSTLYIWFRHLSCHKRIIDAMKCAKYCKIMQYAWVVVKGYPSGIYQIYPPKNWTAEKMELIYIHEFQFRKSLNALACQTWLHKLGFTTRICYIMGGSGKGSLIPKCL